MQLLDEDGLAVYRLVDFKRWKRMKWEEQARGDVILRIWFNKGDIENIQRYIVTEQPDLTKLGCPVLCDETPIF
jgi:hypothetical protein